MGDQEDDKSKAGKAKKGGSMLTISAGHRVIIYLFI
jgi:hypothetical protein